MSGKISVQCFRCKDKVSIVPDRVNILSNGKPAVGGVCNVCGKDVITFCSKADSVGKFGKLKRVNYVAKPKPPSKPKTTTKTVPKPNTKTAPKVTKT